MRHVQHLFGTIGTKINTIKEDREIKIKKVIEDFWSIILEQTFSAS